MKSKKVIVSVALALLVVGGITTYTINRNRNIKTKEAATVADQSKVNVVKDDMEEKKPVEVKPNTVIETKVDEKENVTETTTQQDSKVKEAVEQLKQAESTNSNTNQQTNTGTSSKPSSEGTATPAPVPVQPKPTSPPAPKPEQPKPTTPPAPTRASGIDWELTDKLQAKSQMVEMYNSFNNNGRADVLKEAAVKLALDNVVSDAIKEPWNPSTYAPSLFFKYMSHTVNVVTGTTTYSYLGFKNPEGFNDGFKYVLAYWDSSINGYKLFYVTIRLA